VTDVMPPSLEDPAGPFLDVWAKIGVRLEGLTAELAEQRHAQARAYEEISFRPVQPLQFLGSAAPVVLPVFVPLGWNWAVQLVTCNGLGAGSSSAATATGTITAGAGSAALAAGVSATGFTISFSTAPSTAGTATLSNVAGGPYVYNIPAGQTSPYTVNFPAPIAAAGAPTLTVAGLGIGAGTIILYGQSTAAADQLLVYRGAAPSSAVLQNEKIALSAAVPFGHAGRTGLILKPQQSLVFGGTLTAATTYTVNIDVIEVTDAQLPAFLM
jgi:hypothetical protein